ncbi:hypothetical protein LTR78_001743 [Recurvomyces mirabilis]|uniref:Uncharacterized protein n=1 Tax=Recurvomyces mirabilis TaxID=574656 RepID=A0AAE0WUH8_9PEZI|nr:hypothetical protein LTR78_001743 [Recurvomyces mirabilis]KAK5150182.1 hypothetical protein LTS14_010311 [Recurvomyces mirabilis]
MDGSEVFAMLGFPVRILGRLPLSARYAFGPPSSLLNTSEYATQRYGQSYRFRPWLRFDIHELEKIERLVNHGSDEEVLKFRQTQLSSGGTTTVVGSLLAATCATMLTIDTLSDLQLYVRALFTISLTVSLMSVYFTLVQQRELGLPTSAETLRRWLCNGHVRRTEDLDDDTHAPLDTPTMIRESSLAANILLQVPFEMLSIAISVFLAGLATYLGLAMAEHVQLGNGKGPGNGAYLVALLICTAFTLIVFGQALGQKDREALRCSELDVPRPDRDRARFTKKG